MHQADACILRAVHPKHYRSIAHRILLCCLAGQLNLGMNTSGWFFPGAPVRGTSMFAILGDSLAGQLVKSVQELLLAYSYLFLRT
jgi:hypothetical protein